MLKVLNFTYCNGMLYSLEYIGEKEFYLFDNYLYIILNCKTYVTSGATANEGGKYFLSLDKWGKN